MYAIINDTHLDLKRKTGVTKESLLAYEDRQLLIINSLLLSYRGRPVIVLGDLFNSGQASFRALLRIASLLRHHEKPIFLVAGNHDLNKNLEIPSAIDVLSAMVPNIVLIKDPFELEPGCVIIPHVPNQEIFDQCIADAVDAGASTLLAHCNYDNGFALEKDHSLNLSAAQAELFEHVILGHEHNKRDLPGVDILGAPLPCNFSEAGCVKGYHLWPGPGHELEFVPVWNPEAALKIDWSNLDEIPVDVDFVQVTGTALPEEAAVVIQKIEKARKELPPDLFMITNNVMVDGHSLGESLEMTEHDLAAFDAMEELMTILPEKYHSKLLELRGL